MPRRLQAGRGLHGSVVETLGRAIVSGRYAEGTVLPVEAELGEGLEVSRSVVREAVRVLAAKGLVEARPMRGTIVRSRREWRLLDPDVLRWWVAVEGEATILHDLLEVRAMVEPAAARIAATRANPADREVLQEAYQALVVSIDELRPFEEADQRLHAAILGVCRNAILDELGEMVSATLRLGHQAQAHIPGDQAARRRDSLPLHGQVVSAIVAGHPATAERHMRELVEAAARDAELVLGVRPDPGNPS
ncbi:MAG: FadR/GntR family transcriptional regulator [Chloroflexota bacterium]